MWDCGLLLYQKIWESVIFTRPENMGEWYFHSTRKCGGVVFLPYQKIWMSVIFTPPENMGECRFHVIRKCGRMFFALPENMGEWNFYITRKYGRVVISRYQKIFVGVVCAVFFFSK
jgi:hypothetical protein